MTSIGLRLLATIWNSSSQIGLPRQFYDFDESGTLVDLIKPWARLFDYQDSFSSDCSPILDLAKSQCFDKRIEKFLVGSSLFCFIAMCKSHFLCSVGHRIYPCDKNRRRLAGWFMYSVAHSFSTACLQNQFSDITYLGPKTR